MGYLLHQAMIVSDWSEHRIATHHAKAKAIFEAAGLPGIVSPIVMHAVNGSATFLVAPDGSKEGWSDSEAGDRAREELKAYLAPTFAEWCEVTVGGDDRIYGVTASAAYPEEEVDGIAA